MTKRITDCDLETSIADWGIEHPQTLPLFQELNIDYCCGGKSLRYVCHQQGLDAELVLEQLMFLLDTNPRPG